MYLFLVLIQIDRISGIATKYVGKPLLSSYPNLLAHDSSRSLDVGVGKYWEKSGSDLLRSVTVPTEADKPMIVELAVTAMEELMKMANAGEPLWIHSDINSTDILNEEEYFRNFHRGPRPKPLGFKSEASRESAVVIMNHSNLVEILMDVVIFLINNFFFF